MLNIRKHFLIKVISMILIVAFLNVQFAEAYPSGSEPNTNLSVQSPFQGQMFTPQAEAFKGSILADARVMTSVFTIADYVFAGAESRAPDGVRYLETFMRNLFPEEVFDGIRLESVVSVRHLRKEKPGELEKALSDMGLDGYMPVDNILLIPYKKGDVKQVIQVAPKGTPIEGVDIIVSDKYSMKVLTVGNKGEEVQKMPARHSDPAPVQARAGSKEESGQPAQEIDIEAAKPLDSADKKVTSSIPSTFKIKVLEVLALMLTPLAVFAGETVPAGSEANGWNIIDNLIFKTEILIAASGVVAFTLLVWMVKKIRDVARGVYSRSVQFESVEVKGHIVKLPKDICMKIARLINDDQVEHAQWLVARSLEKLAVYEWVPEKIKLDYEIGSNRYVEYDQPAPYDDLSNIRRLVTEDKEVFLTRLSTTQRAYEMERKQDSANETVQEEITPSEDKEYGTKLYSSPLAFSPILLGAAAVSPYWQGVFTRVIYIAGGLLVFGLLVTVAAKLLTWYKERPNVGEYEDIRYALQNVEVRRYEHTDRDSYKVKIPKRLIKRIAKTINKKDIDQIRWILQKTLVTGADRSTWTEYDYRLSDRMYYRSGEYIGKPGKTPSDNISAVEELLRRKSSIQSLLRQSRDAYLAEIIARASAASEDERETAKDIFRKMFDEYTGHNGEDFERKDSPYPPDRSPLPEEKIETILDGLASVVDTATYPEYAQMILERVVNVDYTPEEVTRGFRGEKNYKYDIEDGDMIGPAKVKITADLSFLERFVAEVKVLQASIRARIARSEFYAWARSELVTEPAPDKKEALLPDAALYVIGELIDGQKDLELVKGFFTNGLIKKETTVRVKEWVYKGKRLGAVRNYWRDGIEPEEEDNYEEEMVSKKVNIATFSHEVKAVLEGGNLREDLLKAVWKEQLSDMDPKTEESDAPANAGESRYRERATAKTGRMAPLVPKEAASAAETGDVVLDESVTKAGTEDQPEQVNVVPLYDVVTSVINNDTSKLVNAGNQIMHYCFTNGILIEGEEGFLPLERNASVGELRTRLDNLRNAVANLDVEVPERVKDAIKVIDELGPALAVDAIVANLIILARKAKNSDQKLILGLEMDWIPGRERGDVEQATLKPLIKEIEKINKFLEEVGVDNVIVVSADGEVLGAELLAVAGKNSTELSNIVVLASKDTIATRSFNTLRSTQAEQKAFIGEVETEGLEKAYAKSKDKVDEHLDVDVVGMLSVLLEMAAGKTIAIPNKHLPFVTGYDPVLRIVQFLPKMEKVDFNEFRERMSSRLQALRSA